MIKGCTLQEISFSMCIGFLSILNVYLLAENDYLRFKNIDDVFIGLLGGEIEGSYIDYEDIIDTCDTTSVLSNYCANLPALRNSGLILYLLLLLDFLILFISLILSIIHHLLVIKIMKHISTSRSPSKFLNRFAKIVVGSRSIIFAHPLCVNSGLVLWLIYGKIKDLQDSIVFGNGVAVLILQCFFSLLLTAFSFWQLSS